MRRNNTEYLVKLALLTAVSTVLNIFTLQVLPNNSNVISFAFIPNFIAGIFMGPLAGLCTGWVGDLLGHFIAPQGSFMVTISLSSALLGLIPGLVFKYIKGNGTFKMTLSFILCYVICTAALNTIGIWYVYASSKSYFVYLFGRLPFQTLNLVANYVIMLGLYESSVLHKLFKRGNKLILKKTS